MHDPVHKYRYPGKVSGILKKGQEQIERKDVWKDEGYCRYLALEYEDESPYEEIPEWIERLQDIVG